ncbi:MAG: ATP-dependent 6-phosphofructokinase [Lachnospiraceae bacterium]
MRRIGILTSGGDCQALNAVMRGVIKSLDNRLNDLEVYGFLNGFKGLLFGEYRKLIAEDFSGILTKGGTILGSGKEPFKDICEPGENGLDKIKAMKATVRRLELECLVVLGGTGSQKTANRMREEGLNIIYLPKSMDNAIFGTDITYGFYSGVNIATEAIDCIHTTSASHNRVFIVEIMGHEVGWMALYAGMAGGADIILIPEIPYDLQILKDAIEHRCHKGRSFTILAVAEGAMTKEDAALSKKDYREKLEGSPVSSPVYELAGKLEKMSGTDVRVIIPGHMQRGGSPSPQDRLISTRMGAAAAELVIKKEYGYMVAIVNDQTIKIPLDEVTGRTKTIDPDSQIVAQARQMGICFGD